MTKKIKKRGERKIIKVKDKALVASTRYCSTISRGEREKASATKKNKARRFSKGNKTTRLFVFA